MSHCLTMEFVIKTLGELKILLGIDVTHPAKVHDRFSHGNGQNRLYTCEYCTPVGPSLKLGNAEKDDVEHVWES